MQIAVASSWGENGFSAEKFETEVGKFKGEITSGEEEFPIKVTVDGQSFQVSGEGEVREEANPGKKVTGSNKVYTKNGTAIIPVGFAIVPDLDDVSKGLVISDVENDTENKGNQFVWIPVEKEEDYKTNTTYVNKTVSEKTENDVGYLPSLDGVDIPSENDTEQKKEKYLATNKGGFYISRYEAGDSSAKANRISATDGTLVSKKDAYVYNYISQTDAKAKAKTFINDKNVKSALITGIQWDMVMAFITTVPPRKDGKGNDYDVTQASNDTSSQTSSNRHLGSLKQCGQNEADRVCNIYDLEGNSYEYVAEKNTYNTNKPYVDRGGSYLNIYSASNRNGIDGDARNYRSFRLVLYVM